MGYRISIVLTVAAALVALVAIQFGSTDSGKQAPEANVEPGDFYRDLGIVGAMTAKAGAGEAPQPADITTPFAEAGSEIGIEPDRSDADGQNEVGSDDPGEIASPNPGSGEAVVSEDQNDLPTGSEQSDASDGLSSLAGENDSSGDSGVLGQPEPTAIASSVQPDSSEIPEQNQGDSIWSFTSLDAWVYVALGFMAGWIAALTVWVYRIDRRKDFSAEAIAKALADALKIQGKGRIAAEADSGNDLDQKDAA